MPTNYLRLEIVENPHRILQTCSFGGRFIVGAATLAIGVPSAQFASAPVDAAGEEQIQVDLTGGTTTLPEP